MLPSLESDLEVQLPFAAVTSSQCRVAAWLQAAMRHHEPDLTHSVHRALMASSDVMNMAGMGSISQQAQPQAQQQQQQQQQRQRQQSALKVCRQTWFALWPLQTGYAVP